MAGIILALLGLFCWAGLFYRVHKRIEKYGKSGIPFAMRGGGDDEQPPAAPSYQLPSWASNLPPEILSYIRQGVGQQLAEPGEYGVASQTLQDLLGYTPEQFQYPMEDIQKALAAQQALQLQQYQQQIRPMMAQQGQLDSSYYTNLLGNYLQGQQAQTYGTTADLLTNQAQQNYQLQQWLPQFKASVSQALQGLGGSRSGINEFNMKYPYQTYIPAMSSLYGQGQQQGNMEYQSALNQYNQQMQNYQNSQDVWSNLLSGLGGIAGSIISPSLGNLGTSLASLFSGNAPTSSVAPTNNYGLDLSGLTSSQYKPSWAQSNTGSQLYNYY